MINELKSYDLLTCENACKNNSECVWFTYHSNQHLCVLLNECLIRKRISGTISGRSRCENQDLPGCNLVGKCTGILLNVAKADTSEVCLDICKNDECSYIE